MAGDVTSLSEIERVLDDYPPDTRAALLRLRDMIFDVAASTEGVGEIVQTLKWGQPSFEAVNPKSGTPLRIGVPKTGGVGLYAHCQTTVISQARDVFSDTFEFDGNRGVLLPLEADWPEAALRQVIRTALTYRLAGRSR